MALFITADIFEEEARFNVPGPIAESNWTEPLDKPVRQWDNDKARLLARLIRETRR